MRRAEARGHVSWTNTTECNVSWTNTTECNTRTCNLPKKNVQCCRTTSNVPKPICNRACRWWRQIGSEQLIASLVTGIHMYTQRLEKILCRTQTLLCSFACSHHRLFSELPWIRGGFWLPGLAQCFILTRIFETELEPSLFQAPWSSDTVRAARIHKRVNSVLVLRPVDYVSCFANKCNHQSERAQSDALGVACKRKRVNSVLVLRPVDYGSMFLTPSVITRVSWQKDAEICLIRARNRMDSTWWESAMFLTTSLFSPSNSSVMLDSDAKLNICF